MLISSFSRSLPTTSLNFVVDLKTEINLFSMGTLHDVNQFLTRS
jgi:hypothetical protein